jgi:hypothetical protein
LGYAMKGTDRSHDWRHCGQSVGSLRSGIGVIHMLVSLQ